MLELSQVIYGVRDLAAAATAVEALGLTTIEGGHHPGLGTANRIVPLNRQYFELLGVVERTTAAANPYGQALIRRIAGGDCLVRWSLRTDDIEGVAGRLGLPIESRQRLRPDGVRLSWRAAGLDLSLRESWLPFFMQWDDPHLYPGTTPVQHAAGATGVAWLELATDDPVRLKRWMGAADVPLRVVAGPPGLRRVAIATAGGDIVLPPTAD